MSAVRQDAMTRERNLAAVSKGFAGRFAKRLFIEGDVLSVQLFAYGKKKLICVTESRSCGV